VTEGVVDALEVVEIQHQETDRSLRPGGPGELVREALAKGAAVGEPGQVVGDSEPAEFDSEACILTSAQGDEPEQEQEGRSGEDPLGGIAR
jgi:hypothetical protein